MTLRLPACLAVAATVMLSPLQALAATDYFYFNWNTPDGETPQLVSDTGYVFTATGTVGITYDDVTGAFDADDMFDISITVSNDVLGSFVIDDWRQGGGSVQAGQARFDADTEPQFDSLLLPGSALYGQDYFFGCFDQNCGTSTHLILIVFDGTEHAFSYDDADEAARSMAFSAIPAPAAAPLALTGLAALGLAGRRARRRRG